MSTITTTNNMSTELNDKMLQVLDPILDFVKKDDEVTYNSKVKDFITRLQYSTFETILCLLTDQSALHTIPQLAQTVYVMDYRNNKFRHHLDVAVDLRQAKTSYHNEIQCTETCMTLTMLSLDSLFEYIMKHDKKQYIFMPFNYSSPIKEAGHQAALVLDNNNHKVYLLDPNGSPTYFNNLLADQLKNEFTTDDEAQLLNHSYGVDYSIYVENMLSAYFDQLELYGLKYSYVKMQRWNPYGISLNGDFNNSVIGNGHCVILVFLLMHYATTTKLPIEDTLQSIGKFTKNELATIINNYTCNIYKMFRDQIEIRQNPYEWID
jgi:hypothetical protein